MSEQNSTNSLGNRPAAILTVGFKERGSLYAAYMPFLANGGIFVPTQKTYALGDELTIIISLMEDAQKFPIRGKVAWVTPAGSMSTATTGVGVQFPAGDDISVKAKQRIEEILSTALASSRKTHTL